MQDLSEIRQRINAIDEQILDLFMERMETAAEVAEFKRATGKPVFDRDRERENILRASQHVPVNLANYAAALESLLMEASREAQYQKLGLKSPLSSTVDLALSSQQHRFPFPAHVGCRKVEGTCQQVACDCMFEHPQISSFSTYDEVFLAIEQGHCEFGVLPIEHSTAGSITHVYELLMRYSFHIVRTCLLSSDHSPLDGTEVDVDQAQLSSYTLFACIAKDLRYLGNSSEVA